MKRIGGKSKVYIQDEVNVQTLDVVLNWRQKKLKARYIRLNFYIQELCG